MSNEGKKVDTIEKLAALVADGFYDVHARMDTMEKRLEKKMSDGFEGVEGKIGGLHRRIDDEVDQRVDLGLRVEKVEAKVFPELSK